ncbi:HWE histidine kinase domain-containing protein [Dapis sp. BLCC M126]|uniref:HWE histidine kinase domain-containing protein n=1 Tax=Dapis sp. BLCC M126 TaxID=3400189 RepID=UPI003CE9AD12
MSDSSATLWELAIAKCCEEPVHSPGSIQSFGALVVTDLALETITHVSANLAEMLGIASQAPLPELDEQNIVDGIQNHNNDQNWDFDGTSVLGQSLDTVLSHKLIHDLANVCGLPWIDTQVERMGVYELNERSFNVCVHVQGNRTLIELEPLLPTVERSHTLITQLKLLLKDNPDSQTMLSDYLEKLRYATEFDRIMVYRFLHDGAGEVIAEARAEDMASFLNLRFPASDIPESTREILQKTPLRIIPDLSAPLVPLFAWDETEAPLDLSFTSIRGASLIHTQEYLPNMGIASSMTLAIIIEGKLWGLFAFHYRQPKLLSPEFRSIIELSGLLISLYLQQKLTEEDLNYQRYAGRVLNELFSQQIKTENDWQTLLRQSLPQLCKLISANGLAFITDRQVLSKYGDLPENSVILKLIEQTQVELDGDILSIDSLSRLTKLEEITEQDWIPSAGALFVPIETNNGYYLVFFRNETISEVNWAGNPDEQEIFQGKNLTGAQLCPRRSFESYKKEVLGYCCSWSRQDLLVAKELHTALGPQGFVHERQGLLIAELKHRVKNILALILSVARQTGRSSRSIAQYIQVLENRISALATAHELVTRQELLWPKLHDLLILELRPYLSAESISSRVTFSGVNVTVNSSFVPTFVLVLHEMVSNAVKYGALSVPDGQLRISWFKDRNGLMLLWRESDGPTVYPPDTESRGFGCELIQRAIPYEFGGEGNLLFAPSGVEANFWLPDQLVKWDIEESSSSSSLQLAPSQLERQFSASPQSVIEAEKGTVLLVEDNMLIAIEMENLLKKFGFTKIDSAPTVDRAMKLLSYDRNPYQVCLLDINLKTKMSFSIAYHLSKTQIPFAFVSGYDSKRILPEDLKHIPLLKKPINFDKLSTILQTLLDLPRKDIYYS